MSNYLIMDVPRAFHMAQPVDTRPTLRMFKGAWFWVYWVIVVPSVLMMIGTVALPALLLDGTVSVVAALLMVVEILVVVAVVLWLKISRGTPIRMAVLAVLWGGSAAMIMTSTFGAAPMMSLVDKLGWYSLTASFVGAYPEEIMKGLGIWFVLMIGRSWWNRPWHGIVAGMLVGVGFDAVENMIYSLNLAPMNPESDMQGMLQIFGMRTVVGAGLHIIFSGFVGFGIGQALFARTDRRGVPRTKAWRLGQVVLWGAAGFAAHFAFNAMLFSDYPVIQLIWHIGVWLVIVTGLVVLIWRQTKRLKPELDAGLYPAVTLYIKQFAPETRFAGVPLGVSGLPAAWPQPVGQRASLQPRPPLHSSPLSSPHPGSHHQAYVRTTPQHRVPMPSRSDRFR